MWVGEAVDCTLDIFEGNLATPDGLFLALESLSAAFFALSSAFCFFISSFSSFFSLSQSYISPFHLLLFVSSLCFRISAHALLVNTLAPETHFAAAFLFSMLPERIELST